MLTIRLETEDAERVAGLLKADVERIKAYANEARGRRDAGAVRWASDAGASAGRAIEAIRTAWAARDRFEIAEGRGPDEWSLRFSAVGCFPSQDEAEARAGELIGEGALVAVVTDWRQAITVASVDQDGLWWRREDT